MVGFVVAVRGFPASAELTFAAVRPERHRSGIGRGLVDRAVADLAADGVTLVEVKTLDESAGYEPYVATRAFWEQQGFVQIDCIDPLPGWQPGNPPPRSRRRCARPAVRVRARSAPFCGRLVWRGAVPTARERGPAPVTPPNRSRASGWRG